MSNVLLNVVLRKTTEFWVSANKKYNVQNRNTLDVIQSLQMENKRRVYVQKVAPSCPKTIISFRETQAGSRVHTPASVRAWRCSRTTAAASPGRAGSCTGPGCFPVTAGKPRCGSTWGSSRSVPGSSSRRCSGCWRSPSSRCWALTHSGAHWWRWQSPGRPLSPGLWQGASLRLSRSVPGTSWRTCWSGWPYFGCNCPGRRAGRSPRPWRWLASSEQGLDQNGGGEQRKIMSEENRQIDR